MSAHLTRSANKVQPYWQPGTICGWAADGIGFIRAADGSWRSFSTNPDACIANGPGQFWCSPSGAVIAVRQRWVTYYCDGSVRCPPSRASIAALCGYSDAYAGDFVISRPAAIAAIVAVALLAIAGAMILGGSL